MQSLYMLRARWMYTFLETPAVIGYRRRGGYTLLFKFVVTIECFSSAPFRPLIFADLSHPHHPSVTAP